MLKNQFLVKCWGMLKPLLMWYAKLSDKSSTVFLPTHCQGKLKNSEFASVFYCRCTPEFQRLHKVYCLLFDLNIWFYPLWLVIRSNVTLL